MQEKHKELGEWIDENKLQMIDKLIAILQDIFSKNNLQKFWRKQVSIAGKIRFFSQDKKSSDLTQGIAVPSGVRDICTALSQLTEEKEPQNKKEKVLKDICFKS